MQADRLQGLAEESEIIQPLDMNFEDADGWQYRVRVIYTDTDPNSSPGGCIDVAPPGPTNLTFLLVVENLLSDREAPMAELVFRSNLVGDGTVVAGKPFTDAVKDAQMPFFVDGEVVPNREDTRCIDASSIGPAYGNIPQGALLNTSLPSAQ